MLTDSKIRTLPSPKGKMLKATDANGLYLEFRPSGRKVWIYRYRIDGKESLFTLGEYPTAIVPRGETAADRDARMKALVFTLAEARVERDKARLLVMQGINPSTQRKHDNAKADALHTFSALAAEWIGEDGKQWTERYRQQVTNRLQQDAFPTLGNLNVQDITARHVGDMLAIVKARSPTAAKHLQAWAGAVFRFAAKKALIDNAPSYPWRGSIKGHKVEHHPPLPEKTLPAFLRSMDKTSAEFQTMMAAKLLWFTVCRSVEVREAQWPEIDLDAARWDIPADRMKMKEPHTVPLPVQAVALLKTLKELTGGGNICFPTAATGVSRYPMKR
ncbi:MAG: integrase arm-type DNA-binding domain-containing protein [Proteobacteria bacterium]|nr:integrase arm-type DNA-binding domain-containing protein [Pseudomonadota bacterium]